MPTPSGLQGQNAYTPPRKYIRAFQKAVWGNSMENEIWTPRLSSCWLFLYLSRLPLKHEDCGKQWESICTLTVKKALLLSSPGKFPMPAKLTLQRSTSNTFTHFRVVKAQAYRAGRDFGSIWYNWGISFILFTNTTQLVTASWLSVLGQILSSREVCWIH